MASSRKDDPMAPIGLKDMVIGSVDTLRGTELSQKIPPTWQDQPPLLQGPRNTQETPQLLKAVIRQGVPPALRCAVWLSNIVQAVHPHQDASYWHEYRTLAKVQALEHAYDVLLSQIASTSPTSSSSCTNGGANNNGQQPPADNSAKDAAVWESMVAPTYGYKRCELVTTTTTTTCPVEAAAVAENGSDRSSSNTILIEGTTAAGALAQTRVLVALDRILSGGSGYGYHAPLVPALVALLLTAQSESYAFCAVREMSHQTSTSWYFAVGPTENAAWRKAFGDVLTKLHPQTAEYLDDRGVLDDLRPIFQDFFLNILPLEYCLRILDIYTLEGSKVLYRVGVALLVLFKKESAEQLLTISNATDWWHYFRQWTHQPNRFSFDTVIRKAYGVHGGGGGGRGSGSGGGGMLRRPLRFPRRAILQRIIRMEEARLQREKLENGEYGDESLNLPPAEPLGLAATSHHSPAAVGVEEEPSTPVLGVSREFRLLLAEWMPLTLRYTNLDLLYSTNHHGRSLDMFYRRVKHAKHTVILCEIYSMEKEQEEGEVKPVVVGMYASQAWRVSTEVYGDGACYLFRLQPNPKAWKWTPEPPESTSCAVRADSHKKNLLDGMDLDSDYSFTSRKNKNNKTALLEQFMVSTNNYISMGGNPDGSSGLRLNEDFTKGESSTAVGFGNEPLHGVGHGSVFEVGLVEVYGLQRQIDGKTERL